MAILKSVAAKPAPAQVAVAETGPNLRAQPPVNPPVSPFAYDASEVQPADLRLLNQQLASIDAKVAAPTHAERVARAVVGAVSTAGSVAFVGYVIWVLRASSLVAGALSGLPMWRFLDPLPVLDRWRKRKTGEPEPAEDSDQSIKKLESMFK
jgi:hypothetical protein